MLIRNCGSRLGRRPVSSLLATRFIAKAAFHKVAGELHYSTSGGKTIIEGDVNGDGRADFQIELTASKTLTSADFIL